MVQTYHRFGLTAAACLIGLATSTWGNEFPCVDEQCLPGPRPSRAAAAAAEDDEESAAAAPAEDDEEVAAAAAVAARGPAMFAAPTPSGEVEGARNSYSLPSIELTLPKMSFGLPEFRIRGMGRGRREAQMRLDEGTAPMASGAPAIYGPLLGAGLQQQTNVSRPASAAPASAPPAEPAAAAAPAGCVDARTLQQQSEEVRQLSMQVQQLQGLLLQLAEQQAAGETAGETAVEEGQLAPEVTYVPRKTKLVSTTRAARTSPKQPGSVAAAQRLQLLQQTLDEKQAEVEALMLEQEEIEASEQQEIEEAEDRLATRKKQLEAERVARLRNRMARESTSQELAARNASIERVNYESEKVAEPEVPVPAAPKEVMSRPTRMKSVPATPIRRTVAEVFEDR